jgi:hypothetical protein
MPSMTVEDLMQRVKSLQEFTVETDLPDNFQMNGKIPYDIKIKGNKAFVKVYAADLQEAQNKVYEYLFK